MGSERILQELRVDKPIIDIKPITINDDKYLALLGNPRDINSGHYPPRGRGVENVGSCLVTKTFFAFPTMVLDFIRGPFIYFNKETRHFVFNDQKKVVW